MQNILMTTLMYFYDIYVIRKQAVATMSFRASSVLSFEMLSHSYYSIRLLARGMKNVIYFMRQDCLMCDLGFCAV